MSKNLFVNTAAATVATVGNILAFTVSGDEVSRLLEKKGKGKSGNPAGRAPSPWLEVIKNTPIGSGFAVISSVNPDPTISNAEQNVRNACKTLVEREEVSPRHIKIVRNYRRPLLDENGNQQKNEKGEVVRVGPNEEVSLAIVMEGNAPVRKRKAKEGEEGQESAPAPTGEAAPVSESAPATA